MRGFAEIKAHPRLKEPKPQVHDKISFLKVSGANIVNEFGENIKLKGICFGNQVWQDVRIPRRHHNADDYKVISNLGMNTVRFYLNYKTLESDNIPFSYKSDGWNWLDQNIEWAKKNGVYIILNLHIPQGGRLKDGNALFNDSLNIKRFKSLWLNIAKRYSHEPTIAGYDILNEPAVPNNLNQWRRLAQETIDTIRKVDQNHIIIIEKIFGSPKRILDEDRFVPINDKNYMYSFHFYTPLEYSHQTAKWTKMGNQRNVKYPGIFTHNGRKTELNRSYIYNALKQYIEFGTSNNIPLYVGEFGLIREAFNNGGIKWVGDVIDEFNKYGIHFTYHAYNEKDFGLFYKSKSDNNVNYKLLQLFKEKLK